jgi:pseudouridine-5'-phosphate glycosidase
VRSVSQTSFSAPVAVSDEVAGALATGRPVVALESTIIAHGLPRPRNLEVARELEAQLRGAGVTPATVGVVDGRPLVGLGAADLERMAGDDDIAKASVRDLPAAMATGSSAATTVAATAFLAAKAGVRVFATGGLGGVHLGASDTFDESADLYTLARTPITVVCAGVKSILDVPATLERLESLGVTVVGYGTNTFPGFYISDSGLTVEWQVDDSATVAGMMAAADALGLDSALVVTNPLPPDHQLEPALHKRILDDAFDEAEAKGVHGKDFTPFVLDYFHRETDGVSLEVNVRVIRSNVALAGRIARAWSSG